MSDVLRKLLQMVQEMSPFVWQTLLRQVHIHAIQNIIWAVFFSISVFVFLRLAKHSWLQSNEDPFNGGEWKALCMVSIILAIACLVASLESTTSAIGRFLNPDFYALQYILSQLKP